MSEGIGRDGDLSSDDFPLRDGCNSESIRFAIRKLVSTPMFRGYMSCRF
jgi:hypothetical protein